MTEDNKNRTDAARRGDWKTIPMPDRHETFVLDRSFSNAQMAALRRGNIPQAMEDKWFWYMEGSTLFAHRSWTGYCIYIIDFKEDGRHLVTVNRDPEQYGCTNVEEDAASLNRLLDRWTGSPYDPYNAWLSEIYENLERTGKGMQIKKADSNDADALAALAIQMWPDHDPGELAEEFREILANGEAVCFIGYADGRPVAFAQCQLRHDYVEGTHSSPVGYLEGIFVAEGYRRKGCAARLLAACEAWAKEKGCTEFAGDCELDNAESISFHAATGFTQTNRIVCFKKKL